jgi:N-methylhydantoinase A/oxoprolinase/acetone carboxylase beta subunit
MVAVDSIAAGGSTIARVIGGRVSVGPESQGIAPGPACYGRGGTDATITDVNLALGYIDPDYFLGGALRLDRSRAERAIQRHIAAPLKLDLASAASAVRETITALMSEKLRALLKETREAPEAFTMFVLGGCGALHACALADSIGIGSMLAFPYSSVFSAFGASTTDVQHFYSRTLMVSKQPEVRDHIAREIGALVQQARRDMEVEGFSDDLVSASLRGFMLNGSAEPMVIGRCRLSEASGQRWSDDLLAAVAGIEVHSSVAVEISVVAEAGVPHWNPTGSVNGVDRGSRQVPIKSERVVHWSARESLSTPIFAETQLTPGVTIDGPGIVESSITNYVIAPGWRFRVDERNHYSLERRRD